MKKLFTLIAAALMAVGANAAQKDLGNPTNNASGGWFDETTKKITFVEAGSYKPGWWLAWNNATNSNSGQDFSAFDKVVVELSDIQNCGTISFYFEYIDESVEQDIATVDATTGKATITLKEAGKNAVKQMYLQATEAGGTCTFVAAYAENDVAPLTSVDLFKGTSTVTLGWNEDSAKGEVNMVKGTITDEAQSLLKVGNYIGVDYTCEPYESDEDSRYYQVQFMGGWWTALEGAIGTNGAEKAGDNILIPLEATSTNVEFKLTESDVATLKQQGSVKLAGHGIYVSRIYISEKSQAPAAGEGGEEATALGISWTAEDIAAAGSAKASYGTGDFTMAITDTEGKVAVDANNAYFGDATTQTKFTHRLKSGGKSSSKLSFSIAVPAAGTLKVFARSASSSATDRNLVLTQSGTELYNKVVKDADAIQVKGLDAEDPTKDTNVFPIISVNVAAGDVVVTFPTGALNFYKFEFVSGTTGIKTIVPVKEIENGAIYNLAGQKVNENYKGIVIKNGKKYFQK